MRAWACRRLLRMLLIIAGVVEQCASFPAAVPRLLPSVVVVATRRHSVYRLRVSSDQQHPQETTPTETTTTTESIARNNVLQWTTLQQQDTTVVVEVVTLVEHRPMGCIVEESLATTVTGTVFVASVKQGGNAALAGVVPGDVIVGITGLFGELEDVSGMGIDKVYVDSLSFFWEHDDIPKLTLSCFYFILFLTLAHSQQGPRGQSTRLGSLAVAIGAWNGCHGRPRGSLDGIVCESRQFGR
jgi:hypothetical protein